MKSNKTTTLGAIMAVIVALKPIVDGTGYHLDKKTITELTFAACVALYGYYTKDHDVTGKP
jgi:hypothetical protein